jgi:hypothetical protein
MHEARSVDGNAVITYSPGSSGTTNGAGGDVRPWAMTSPASSETDTVAETLKLGAPQLGRHPGATATNPHAPVPVGGVIGASGEGCNGYGLI